MHFKFKILFYALYSLILSDKIFASASETGEEYSLVYAESRWNVNAALMCYTRDRKGEILNTDRKKCFENIHFVSDHTSPVVALELPLPSFEVEHPYVLKILSEGDIIIKGDIEVKTTFGNVVGYPSYFSTLLKEIYHAPRDYGLFFVSTDLISTSSLVCYVRDNNSGEVSRASSLTTCLRNLLLVHERDFRKEVISLDRPKFKVGYPYVSKIFSNGKLLLEGGQERDGIFGEVAGYHDSFENLMSVVRDGTNFLYEIPYRPEEDPLLETPPGIIRSPRIYDFRAISPMKAPRRTSQDGVIPSSYLYSLDREKERDDQQIIDLDYLQEPEVWIRFYKKYLHEKNSFESRKSLTLKELHPHPALHDARFINTDGFRSRLSSHIESSDPDQLESFSVFLTIFKEELKKEKLQSFLRGEDLSKTLFRSIQKICDRSGLNWINKDDSSCHILKKISFSLAEGNPYSLSKDKKLTLLYGTIFNELCERDLDYTFKVKFVLNLMFLYLVNPKILEQTQNPQLIKRVQAYFDLNLQEQDWVHPLTENGRETELSQSRETLVKELSLWFKKSCSRK